jgi:hypothetical protein
VNPGTRRSTPKGASAGSATKQDHRERTAAEVEVDVRVHAVAVVTQAMGDGAWEPDVASLNALGDLCSAAGRWALVAELEAIA